MKKDPIHGINVFQDDRGRNFIYNKRTKTAYLIQEKDENAYKFYSNRYVIAIFLFVLFMNFIKNIYLLLGIATILVISLEIAYRTKFLANLTQMQNVKNMNKISRVEALVKLNDKKRCLLFGLLYLLFGVMIIVNGIDQKHSPILMIGNIIIAIGASYLGIINFIAFTKIK